jgi:Winged helix DNA-binding domain
VDAAERVLTQRELNRALLARQLLLERSALPLPRAVEQMGGVQTQYAPSAYIGLWSRLDGFERDALTRALERRTLVQATLMRVTIHIVSRRDFWPLAVAIREPRRRWFLRTHKELGESSRHKHEARRLRDFLADGPRSAGEIDARFGKQGWSGAWLDLVRVPPAGTWQRRRADLFGLAEHWIGPCDADVEEARWLLVRRYLGAFGPAPITDIADWAGANVGDVKPTLQRMRLRRFRDEQGRELLDLPRAPLPHPETPAPVRFLPTWDATLLVHARRAGILPEQYRSRIFHVRTPHSFSTFLVDGAVAGTWRYENGRVKLDPFERLSRETRRELAEEAERLAAFHA